MRLSMYADFRAIVVLGAKALMPSPWSAFGKSRLLGTVTVVAVPL
jgi:hypothetical protein